MQGPFIRWEDVDGWTGTDGGWHGRRLVFEDAWTLHMVCDEGYHWSHSHPRSQIVWLVRGELLARIGDPTRLNDIQKKVIRPGEVLLIPGGTHHDMTALTEIETWEVRGMEGPDRWEEFCVRTGV